VEDFFARNAAGKEIGGTKMEKKTICIAGAGPGGLLLAEKLAGAGLDVTVCEALEEKAFGERYRWSDAVSLHILRKASLPVPVAKGNRFIGEGVKTGGAGGLYESRRISEMGLYSEDYRHKAVNDSEFQAVLADRRALAQAQVERARKAGAKIRFGVKAVGFLGKTSGGLEEIALEGLLAEGPSGREELPAGLVVDATGGAGLSRLIDTPVFRPPDGTGCVFRLIGELEKDFPTAFDQQSGDGTPPVRHHAAFAPGGLALSARLYDDRRIDLIGFGATEEAAKKRVSEYVSRLPCPCKEIASFAAQDPRGLPPDSLVAGGFLVLGSAARQVNPAYLAGITGAFTASLLASPVILKAPDYSLPRLWEYSRRWMADQGAHYAALYRRRAEMSAEELGWLLDRGVITAETYTLDLMNYFIPLGINEERRMYDAWSERPALIERLLQAEAASRSALAHYQAYPGAFSPFAFAKWRAGLN
jgi:flavin-dependent dehydrogenase